MTEPLGDILRKQLEESMRRISAREAKNKERELNNISKKVERKFLKIPAELKKAAARGNNDLTIRLAADLDYSLRHCISQGDVEKLPIVDKLKEFCRDNKLELNMILLAQGSYERSPTPAEFFLEARIAF